MITYSIRGEGANKYIQKALMQNIPPDQALHMLALSIENGQNTDETIELYKKPRNADESQFKKITQK